MKNDSLDQLEQTLVRGGASKKEAKKLIHRAAGMGPVDGARLLAGKGVSYQTAFSVLTRVPVTNRIGTLLVWGVAISVPVLSLVNAAYISRMVSNYEPGHWLVRFGLAVLWSILLVRRIGWARWLSALSMGAGAVLGGLVLVRASSNRVDLGDYGLFASIMFAAYAVFSWLLLMNERVDLYFCKK